MTIFRPRITPNTGTSKGGVLDAEGGGHIGDRHAPFQHPQENAMSPDQFERLKDYLDKAGAGLDAAAKAEETIKARNEEIGRMQKDIDRLRLDMTVAAEAAGGLKEAVDEMSKTVEGLEAAGADKDERIAKLEAELEAEKAEHRSTKSTKKKDKGGAAD